MPCSLNDEGFTNLAKLNDADDIVCWAWTTHSKAPSD